MEQNCGLLSARDMQQMGFSRTMVYQLLNRDDLPVVKIGNRRFMHKRLFEAWMENQATSSKKEAAQ